MRVLQLIDSLHPGGAERMAVTFANELSTNIEKSFLCVSREEGLLNSTIQKEVDYCFLNKRRTLDIAAFRKLYGFVSRNKIEVIHAHSSSFFYATLLKILKPKLNLIWHDHYGNSEMLDERKFSVLKWSSRYFSTIISVNETLKAWAVNNLKCKKVLFLNNFVSESTSENTKIELGGDEEYRIVCLANLRPQKDHLNLLRAFLMVKDKYPLASLHLVGKVNNNAYSESVMSFISESKLDTVHVHGAQNGIIALLKKARIGVLSSKSEGLPVSLLEYGIARLAVVCTDVGQCSSVVKKYGKIVPPNDPLALANAIVEYFDTKEMLATDAEAFSNHINASYSFNNILPKILEVYKSN